MRSRSSRVRQSVASRVDEAVWTSHATTPPGRRARCGRAAARWLSGRGARRLHYRGHALFPGLLDCDRRDGRLLGARGAGDRYHHGRAQRPRGKFEFSLDAPWRLEPHFRPGHPLEPEYDPVPIEISIFDEDQWHYDPVVIEPDGGVPIGDGAYVYDGC